MKIIKSSEAFRTIDGEFKFSYVSYFVRENDILYYGKWKDRFSIPDALEQLEDVQQIQTEDRGPAVRPSWSTWSSVYVKTPNLISYIDGVDLETRIGREVETCEVLKRHPHPNIAIYYGCLVTRGRISGLCFKQYTSTLLEKVNPGALNKDMFRSSGRELVNEITKTSLDGIRQGIQHLHSLGLAHNDTNPANIMFDEQGAPVLIDFDSCRWVGESLRDTGVKRTHEWHDPDVETALVKNDLDAFDELKRWLVGSADDKYLFT